MSGSATDQTDIITLENVEQKFKVGDNFINVLNSANFSIKANSFTTIFGPSGSGKSTLLNVLAGLQKPTNGKVTVMGKPLYEQNADELAHFRAKKIGFIHQTNHWIQSLNVIENISIPLYFLGYSKLNARKLAEIALDRVKMGRYANLNPRLLSGGEQQRIAAARALANDPLFIIADEPTGNLDSENANMIMNLLVNAQTEFRRTIILVTHNLEYVPLADQLLKIQDGYVEDIHSKDLETTVNVLLSDMMQRIDNLSKMKKNAKKE